MQRVAPVDKHLEGTRNTLNGADVPRTRVLHLGITVTFYFKYKLVDLRNTNRCVGCWNAAMRSTEVNRVKAASLKTNHSFKGPI